MMLNVLLVDDEPWVLEGLRTMIDWNKYGFQVCGEAQSGPDALRFIQEHRPELVVTDINMPVLNGIELIEQSNQLLAKPPKFVVLSGYDDFSYAQAAMRQRVAEYLLKPVDDDEMGELLVKLSRKIGDEIEAEHHQAKKELFAASHIMNRLIQGEYSEAMEEQIKHSLKLEGNAELQCLLIWMENVFDPAAVKGLLTRGFEGEAGCLFQDGYGRMGFVVQSGASVSGRLQDAAIQIHRELTERMDEPVIIAVSEPKRGLRSIRELYAQTVGVGERKRCLGKSGVFFYQECIRPVNRELLLQKFKTLQETVQEGDPEGIAACVKETFAWIAASPLELEWVKTHVADMEWSICALIKELNGDPAALMKVQERLLGTLGEIRDYRALQAYVERFCLQAGILLSGLKLSNESNTIYQVVQYVDREFRGRLQLQDLARHFHMNATYLGQLFKKTTGKPFNEYLNDKRIEEAKRLLKRSPLKISEVALQVGYPNTDYFINKFKLKTGMLPSAYKQDAGNLPDGPMRER
ncbi:two-component system response regulator YesN [Paenibacillus rhizosphaerae]|uniref:Two-component system response regulator YesN n=1 Tax=Paenibacillus rhizosphaerae TaxID=297318 RepID=A0A839TRA0_9BACL|nr:response regulator [Paenibacillus rhizosphaerae]MBB3129252.1 two-component system response regulator YesN [Paenibacillus rhizosphaerae]